MAIYRMIALLVVVPAIAADDPRAAAEQAWERAIEAKGGRQALQSVRSIVLSSVYTWGGGGRTKGRIESLLVPAFRLWEWFDEPPAKKLGIGVDVIDLENHHAQSARLIGNPTEAPQRAHSPTPGNRDRLKELQLLTFMELRSGRPNILRMWNEMDWLIREIVVEAELEGRRYEWHLDATTYLPRSMIERRPTPYGNGIHVEEYRLEDYRLVDGLQLPHKVTKRSMAKTEKIEYKLNVAYDEDIFNAPPRPSKGPHAWMAKERRTLQDR